MSDSTLVFDYCTYPVIPVKFFNKEIKTPFIDGLLDSGGDFIVIPMPIARYLQLKLKKAGPIDTAGGKTSLYKANLDIALGKKNSNAIYKKHQIYVSARDDIPVLLGRQPIFEDYEITFKKKKNQLILRKEKSIS